MAKPQPADLNGIIENALSMFNGRLDGIGLHKSLAPDLPKVLADSEAIKRAVANLVDNAAEALQESMVREIEISTALVASRDAVEIAVADTGQGVTRELKEKLFLPYFSTKKRGTGLGLAIVSRIVEDHHGSIRVEENHPVGTRFIVELPVVPEPASAAVDSSTCITFSSSTTKPEFANPWPAFWLTRATQRPRPKVAKPASTRCARRPSTWSCSMSGCPESMVSIHWNEFASSTTHPRSS